MAKQSPEELQAKIRELEKEIEIKDEELHRAHKELLKVNSVVEKMISEMSQELRLVGLIQKVLAPTEIPNISGIEFSTKFNPGMKSGGDYFDIFEHEDKLKFGIILASSSGYAMSALFLSVLIKLAAQIEARRGKEPHQVISMMADELVPHIVNQDQASLFYAVVDRRSFELRYSSVGSIQGILQLHGQEKLIRLEPSAGPLMRDFNQKPLTHTLSLGARDRLILCTEGIGDMDLISKAILRAPRVGVHDVRNEILFQSEQASGKSEPARDQTVIVTEVKDRVIKLAKK
jgi:sigma-B regulation protein RsbU (phosphoserine phosphatase)